MAITVYQEASPTVSTTEYSLAAASTSLPTKTDIGVYVAVLDTNAVVLGDQFLVQQYEAARSSGGTKRLVNNWFIDGPQGNPIVVIPGPDGLVMGNGWDLTIKKTAGTDRSIPFTVWKIA